MYFTLPIGGQEILSLKGSSTIHIVNIVAVALIPWMRELNYPLEILVEMVTGSH